MDININAINTYTELALVVDRSGSMHSIANDVRGSVKQFIIDQKGKDGEASLMLSQFDNRYEVICHKDIKEVDGDKFAEQYCPRGSTALLDAIGRTTIAMQNKIESMPEEMRPKRVVVAVITDGLENASREFKIEQIKELIKEKEALGWDFMFMGTTLDTIEVAKNMGFCATKSASYDPSNFRNCMETISENVSKARLNEEVNITEEERDNLR